MLRVTTVWSGFIGGPGYTNLYFGEAGGNNSTAAEAGTVTGRVRAFWLALLTGLPLSVKLDIQPTVANIDPTTGVLQGEYAVTTGGAQMSGTGQEGYSAASGACINWRTATIADGRKLRGKTFLVPIGGNRYQTDGTLTQGFITDILAAAAPLIAPALGLGEALVTWHRPVGGANGLCGRVTSAAVNDRAAVLTSRRQ